MHPLLARDTLEFILSPHVSCYVATADASRRPHVCRAFGCRPCPEGPALVTWVNRPAGAKLLEDISSNARLAFTITHPRSCRTLQLKAVDAAVVPVDSADFARVAAHQDGFVRETVAMGYPEAVMRMIVQARMNELAAIRFTPAAVYGQTPGPNAGAALVRGADTS
jgi:hypothetical protein